MLKKLISLSLTIYMLFCLCACENSVGHSSRSEEKEEETSVVESIENEEAAENEEKSAGATSLIEISPSGGISYEFLNLNGSYYTDTNSALYIPFKYNSKYGVADQEGNPVIENLAEAPTNFSDGFAFVGNNVIDETGKIVFTLPEDFSGGFFRYGHSTMIKKERIATSVYQHDYDVYIATLDTNMNYIKNKVILPQGMHIGQESWYAINENGFQGALGLYGSKTAENRIALVNSQGKIITSFNAKEAFKSANASFACVNFSNSMSHSRATSVSDTDFTKIIFTKNGYANVMNENGQWGLMDLKTEKLVIDYSYDYVGACSENLVPVCKYGSWGVIDIDGNEKIPCKDFKYIGAFTNGKAFALSSNEDICIIDTNGKIINIVDINPSSSTLTGTSKSFFYTDFTEKSQIACFYLYEKAYIISSSGKVFFMGNIGRSAIDRFLYMNNDYLAIDTKSGTKVYKINY